jgi:hypothetical protein
MLDSSRPAIYPTDNEGGFHPGCQTKFPKIGPEVPAAVLALTLAALG